MRVVIMMSKRYRAAMAALLTAGAVLHPHASIEPVCVPETSAHVVWDCGLSINGSLNHAVAVRTHGNPPTFPAFAVLKAIL